MTKMDNFSIAIDMYSVPGLTGMTLEEAVQAARERGFEACVWTPPALSRWCRMKARIRAARVWLGEKIAGQEF